MNLKVAHYSLGLLPTNTFLCFHEETGNGFLVDPAVYSQEVEDAIGHLGIRQLQYILLTHGHFDHILGVNGFLEHHPDAQVVVTELDKPFLTDSVLSHSFGHDLSQDPIRADRIVGDGDLIPFDDDVIRVVATPGHTPGSVCYLIDDVMFSGDTLFQLSCGRTDFPEGNGSDMRVSLQKLKALDGNYHVLPGHGPFTDLDFERKNNPYMR